MVTILTTRFKVQKFYVLPTQCIYIFCMDVRTAIISLYNINSLVYLRRSVFTERYGLYPGPNSSGLYWTLPWIRRLVAGLSPRRCAFNPSSFNVRFVVEKVALWRVFLPVLIFSAVSFLQRSIRIFTYMLCFPDGQTGEAQVPFKKQCSFGNQGALDRKELPLFLQLFWRSSQLHSHELII